MDRTSVARNITHLYQARHTANRHCTCFTVYKLDIGTDFEKFGEKLKGYVERKFDNAKYVMCVVTNREDKMKCLNRITLRNIDMERKKLPYQRRKYHIYH